MKTGLLWYDGNPGCTLADKVIRAARHYQNKHQAQPNYCYVHPDDFEEDVAVAGITVKTKATVLRYHLWIGEDDES